MVVLIEARQSHTRGVQLKLRCDTSLRRKPHTRRSTARIQHRLRPHLYHDLRGFDPYHRSSLRLIISLLSRIFPGDLLRRRLAIATRHIIPIPLSSGHALAAAIFAISNPTKSAHRRVTSLPAILDSRLANEPAAVRLSLSVVYIPFSRVSASLSNCRYYKKNKAGVWCLVSLCVQAGRSSSSCRIVRTFQLHIATAQRISI